MLAGSRVKRQKDAVVSSQADEQSGILDHCGWRQGLSLCRTEEWGSLEGSPWSPVTLLRAEGRPRVRTHGHWQLDVSGAGAGRAVPLLCCHCVAGPSTHSFRVIPRVSFFRSKRRQLPHL